MTFSIIAISTLTFTGGLLIGHLATIIYIPKDIKDLKDELDVKSKLLQK